MPGADEKGILRHTLEAHHDILHDLTYVQACAIWVRDNYNDVEVIPVPTIEGQDIMLRGLYLDALLILYRRCFIGGQRGGLDMSSKSEVLGPLLALHDNELMARANTLTAHAVSASAATTIRVQDGRALPSTFRAGHNKFDFENLIAATGRWLPFVQGEIARLTSAFEQLLGPEDEEGNEIFVAPWGAKIDIQSLRTGRPQVRTRRILSPQPKE